MKRACLLLTIGAFLANPGFAQTADSTTTPAPSTPAPEAAPAPAPAADAPPPPKPAPAAKPGALTKEESQALSKARADVIKADPDLAAERKDLDEKNKAWQKKVDDAAAKSDPNVAAIIAKRDAGKKLMVPPPKDKPKPTEPKLKAPKPPKTSTPSTNAPVATPPTN